MKKKALIPEESILVFITVGTIQFKFTRLFKTVDKALRELNNPSIKIIAQQGESDYNWKYRNVKKYKYMNPNLLIKHIKKANKIITHAGPGTIFLILRHSKITPLIIPRRKKYKEHINDHQVLFTKFLFKKYRTSESLYTQILEYLKNKNTMDSLKNLLRRNNNKKLVIKLKKFFFN